MENKPESNTAPSVSTGNKNVSPTYTKITGYKCRGGFVDENTFKSSYHDRSTLKLDISRTLLTADYHEPKHLIENSVANSSGYYPYRKRIYTESEFNRLIKNSSKKLADLALGERFIAKMDTYRYSSTNEATACVAEKAYGYECTRCKAVLLNRASSHFSTMACKIIDERKELEKSGYKEISLYQYSADHRSRMRDVAAFGLKTLYNNEYWLPANIVDAIEQYDKLVYDDSPVVKDPDKKNKPYTLMQWLNKISGSNSGTPTVVGTCCVTGCTSRASGLQPTVRHNAAMYEFCETHGSEIINAVSDVVNKTVSAQ